MAKGNLLSNVSAIEDDNVDRGTNEEDRVVDYDTTALEQVIKSPNCALGYERKVHYIWKSEYNRWNYKT